MKFDKFVVAEALSDFFTDEMIQTLIELMEIEQCKVNRVRRENLKDFVEGVTK